MNILSDWHHNDLKYSLQLLFERRLNHNLYFPIGLDWYTKGYWNIYPHIDTAKQYLDLRDIYVPEDGTLPLNDIESITGTGLSVVNDRHNNSTHKAITFNQFQSMPIDIVIASIPQHIEPFKKLAAMKGAKFIFQAGNVFPEVDYSTLPNLMTNSLPLNPSSHYVQYHQEMDLGIYHPTTTPPEKLITSYINIYDRNKGYEDFIAFKAELPDFEFRSYGAQCTDGILNTTQDIADMMRRSYFVFHSKYMGDGYGYGLYCSFACGKPVIIRSSDYKGKLGEELLTDMVTCIDLDLHDYKDVCYSISNLSPDKYSYMSQQVYNRFKEKVNFEQEAEKIKTFLNNLQ